MLQRLLNALKDGLALGDPVSVELCTFTSQWHFHRLVSNPHLNYYYSKHTKTKEELYDICHSAYCTNVAVVMYFEERPVNSNPLTTTQVDGLWQITLFGD